MGIRNPFEAPDVTSRRGGPVKQPLSRDVIVSVALELLIRDGIEGMSLRKVAAALDTGPATLYAYVDNLLELRTLVLDRALTSVVIPRSKGDDWRSPLIAILESYSNALRQSPGLAQVAMNTIVVGPTALRIIEALLSLLEQAGADQTTAAWAVDLLILYATATAAEHNDATKRIDTGDALGPLLKILGSISKKEYPKIYASREQLVSGNGPERFYWAVDVLLNGILHTPIQPKQKRNSTKR